MQTESSSNEVVGGGLRKGSDAKASNYALLTLLQGPFSCIGQSFAMGEFKCLLAAWAAGFETVSRDEGFVPVVRGGNTAKPMDGVTRHVALSYFQPCWPVSFCTTFCLIGRLDKIFFVAESIGRVVRASSPSSSLDVSPTLR
jgi:hypothetical protein